MPNMKEWLPDQFEEPAVGRGFKVVRTYRFGNVGSLYLMKPDLTTVMTMRFAIHPEYATLTFQEPEDTKHETTVRYGNPRDIPEILAEWRKWLNELQEKHDVYPE